MRNVGASSCALLSEVRSSLSGGLLARLAGFEPIYQCFDLSRSLGVKGAFLDREWQACQSQLTV
jgi:hypothetical protein